MATEENIATEIEERIVIKLKEREYKKQQIHICQRTTNDHLLSLSQFEDKSRMFTRFKTGIKADSQQDQLSFNV